MAQDKCQTLFLPGQTKWEGRMEESADSTEWGCWRPTFPNQPARGAEWGPSHKRKETPEKQVPQKSYKCRGMPALTVGPLGTNEEGTWPNISWLFWKREPDPNPRDFHHTVWFASAFTLIQKLLLMFCAFFPRDQNGDDFFWFQILSFTVPAGMGVFHAGGRIEMVVNRW